MGSNLTPDQFKQMNLIDNGDGTYSMQGKAVKNDVLKSVLPEKPGSLKDRVMKLQGEIENYPDKVSYGGHDAQKSNTSIIKIQGIVQGLNGSTGLMNNHWTNRKKIKE